MHVAQREHELRGVEPHPRGLEVPFRLVRVGVRVRVRVRARVRLGLGLAWPVLALRRVAGHRTEGRLGWG